MLPTSRETRFIVEKGEDGDRPAQPTRPPPARVTHDVFGKLWNSTNPSSIMQAEERLRRIGKRKPSTTFHLKADDFQIVLYTSRNPLDVATRELCDVRLARPPAFPMIFFDIGDTWIISLRAPTRIETQRKGEGMVPVMVSVPLEEVLGRISDNPSSFTVISAVVLTVGR